MKIRFEDYYFAAIVRELLERLETITYLENLLPSVPASASWLRDRVLVNRQELQKKLDEIQEQMPEWQFAELLLRLQ